MTKERALAKAIQYDQWAAKAEAKADELQKAIDNAPQRDDWSYWTQPIQNTARGRSFEKQRERFRESMRKPWELRDKASRFRSKADNLRAFAARNKGDAAAKRQAARDAVQLKVGDPTYSWHFGAGVITKVNQKTVRIMLDNGRGEVLTDKSYLKT